MRCDHAPYAVKVEKDRRWPLVKGGAFAYFPPYPPMLTSTQYLLGLATIAVAMSSGCAVFVTGEDFPYDEEDAAVVQPAFPSLPADGFDAGVTLGLPPVISVGITATGTSGLPGTLPVGAVPSGVATPVVAAARDAGVAVLAPDAGNRGSAATGAVVDASVTRPSETPSVLDASISSTTATATAALSGTDAGLSSGSTRPSSDAGASPTTGTGAGGATCVASACAARCGLLPPCCNASNQCGCATLLGTCLPPLPASPFFP
ncbi:MAG: hypothetical protein RL385_4373 [Pseudomonadota bacterium]